MIRLNDWSAVFRSVSFSAPFQKKRLPFVSLIKPPFPMRLELLFDCFRKLPEGDALRRIENFTTAKGRDREYGASLREIMGAWKSSPDRRIPSRLSCPRVFHHLARSISPTRATTNRNFNSRSKSRQRLRHYSELAGATGIKSDAKAATGGSSEFLSGSEGISVPRLISYLNSVRRSPAPTHRRPGRGSGDGE